jgi:hypothetical protein
VISDVTLRQTLDTWRAKAEGKAVIDHGFHIAITDLPDRIMDEIPQLAIKHDTSLTPPPLFSLHPPLASSSSHFAPTGQIVGI